MALLANQPLQFELGPRRYWAESVTFVAIRAGDDSPRNHATLRQGRTHSHSPTVQSSMVLQETQNMPAERESLEAAIRPNSIGACILSFAGNQTKLSL